MLAGMKNNPGEENSFPPQQEPHIPSILPNTRMSKNWIPMAKDFSSEATDLKKDKPVRSQHRTPVAGVCCVCVMRVCVVAPCSPEDHHVQGIVGNGGDQSCQRDDQDGGNEELWAAVRTRTGSGLALAPAYTRALSVELHHQEKNNDHGLMTPASYSIRNSSSAGGRYL